MKINNKVLALVCSLSSTGAFALCPDNSSFDASLDFCATTNDVFGPFTNEMVQKCEQYGGGSACSNTEIQTVQGNQIDVLKWSKGFASNIRGTGECPIGSVRSQTYGGHCFESLSGAANNVYGNFDGDEVAACETLSGGTACYTNRWSASFYLAVKNKMSEDNSQAEPVTNRLGAWLWYIDEQNLNKTHEQLAQELADLGVKRIFIKIADDVQSCSLFSDACSKVTTDTYKAQGIEPWAWSYNYPGDYDDQADALFYARNTALLALLAT